MWKNTQKLKIMLQDKTQLKELQQAGISLEGMKLEENSIELIVNTRVFVKLNELGLSYQILIDDMSKYYQERSKSNELEMKNLNDKIQKKQSCWEIWIGKYGWFLYV